MTNTMNIKKRQMIDNSRLSGEEYFASLLQEAYACGLLSSTEIERLQMECIKLLATKCESYSRGESSSIRAEAAESIMKSNLYTIGIYLKSLADSDAAAEEIKKSEVQELYNKGRGLINAKLRAAKDTYRLVKSNRIFTPNYTYNSTLSDEGAGSFFKLYDPEYEAHETAASIDYQLCDIVTDLAGVEYIQRYLENLFLENEFCGKFSHEDIHWLLSGYDTGYKDLLINIYEHVLMAAIGCLLAGVNVISLDITKAEVRLLQGRLSGCDDQSMAILIREAAMQLFEKLEIRKPSIQSYSARCLPRITKGIINAVRTDNLDKVFVPKADQVSKTWVSFESGDRMDDDSYRELVNELLGCRHLSDKLVIIRERIKSFGDFEDLLTDGEFSDKEIISILDILGDIEIAALIKRHPIKVDIGALDLAEREQELRRRLKSYMEMLEAGRRNKIFDIMDSLSEEILSL